MNTNFNSIQPLRGQAATATNGGNSTRKYNYFSVIQQHYGQGWEDVSEYQTTASGRAKEFVKEKWNGGQYVDTKQTLLSHDLKEYRLMGYPTRTVSRRELVKA